MQTAANVQHNPGTTSIWLSAMAQPWVVCALAQPSQQQGSQQKLFRMRLLGLLPPRHMSTYTSQRILGCNQLGACNSRQQRA